MAVAAYSDLRDRARAEAGDLPGLRWPDAEIDRYIEAGQREYVLLRLELQGSFRVESLGEEKFTAPANYIQPYRFTTDDGCDLPFYSFRQLSDDYTPKFLTDNIGSPVMACFNFDNWNQFRFYPMLASGTAGTLFYHRFPENEKIEINEKAILYYVWWRMYLREWDTEYFKKSIHYRKLFKVEVRRGEAADSTVRLPYSASQPTWSTIREELRELLQDSNAAVWDNFKLDEYLNEAQKIYVKRSGCLKSTVKIIPDPVDGKFYFPDNFIDFSFAWNDNDLEIRTSREKLLRANFGKACDSENGLPEYIYDGMAGREYKMFPSPEVTTQLAELSIQPLDFSGISSPEVTTQLAELSIQPLDFSGISFSQQTGAVNSISASYDEYIVTDLEVGEVVQIDDTEFDQENGITVFIDGNTDNSFSEVGEDDTEVDQENGDGNTDNSFIEYDPEAGIINYIEGAIFNQEHGEVVFLENAETEDDFAGLPYLYDKISYVNGDYYYEAFAEPGTSIFNYRWCIRRTNITTGCIEWANGTNSCIFMADDLPSAFEDGYAFPDYSSSNESFSPFNGEYGGCNMLYSYSGVSGNLHYIRAPFKNMIEIRNPEALLWYAAAKCLEEEKPTKDLNKASALRQAFDECIFIENAINHKQTGFRKTGRFK